MRIDSPIMTNVSATGSFSGSFIGDLTSVDKLISGSVGTGGGTIVGVGGDGVDTATSASNLTINADASAGSSGILKLLKGTTEEITIYETSNIAAFETATGNSIWLIPNGDTNAVVQVTTAGHVVPVSLNQDLGSVTNPWRDVYVSSGSLLLSDKKFSVNASGQVSITDSSTGAPAPIVTSDLIVSSSAGAVKLAVSSDGTLETTTPEGGATTGTYSGSFSGSFVGDTIGGLAISSLLASSSIASGVDALSGSAHTQRSGVISELSGSAHTQRSAVISELSGSAHTQRIAISSSLKTYTDQKVAGLVDSAPATLDTLNELAAALNDNPNFSASIATTISSKLAKASNLSDLENTGTALTNLGFTEFTKTIIDDTNAAGVIATLGLDADIATLSLPASTTISTFGASLVDDANAATAIATLGLDADIATLSLPASTTISAFGKTLVDDADAATARTTLGLGTIATLNSIDISDNTNLAVSDTTGQTGINLTLTGDSISGVVSGLGTGNDVQFDSLGIGTAAPGTTGVIRATNDIVAYYSSDERLKDNITPLHGALDKVKLMGGYEFDWNTNQEVHEGHDIGVVAQEVQAQYPELVHERDNGYLAVDYVKLTAVLLQAVKELSAKVDELSK